MNWYALQTHPNHEPVVSRHLAEIGVESYYPSRQHPSRRAARPLPLFPCYVFARFDYERRVPVVRSSHVVRLIGDEYSVISDQEITSIQQMVSSGVGLFTHFSWTRGRRALIQSGPLVGIEGVVIEHAGHHRILLSIDILGRAVSAQVEAEWLCPVGRAA